MSRVFHHSPPESLPGGQRVFLATPVYGGLSAGYALALFASQTALMEAGIAAELAIFAGNCHVDDSRNRLVRDFLASNCTDLVFLDADVRWQPDDLVKLCRYDRDVVGGVYPARNDSEEYPVILPPGENWSDTDGLLEAEGVPAGFLRIRRAVLEKMASSAIRHNAQDARPGDAPIPIIFERSVADNTRWGGDLTFCRRWRALGGKIFIDPEMRLEHYGEKSWAGSLGAHLRRSNGVAIPQGLARIAAGTETPETLRELVEAWGNPGFTATVELLAFCMWSAREGEGPILECGSGLTTLVMAAAAPRREVWALEHEVEWAKRVREFDLPNVNLCVAPLYDYGDFEWYHMLPDISESFTLALVDGPPRSAKGSRQGFATMFGSLTPGAVVVADDADAQNLEVMEEWGRALRTEFNTMGAERPFAVAKLPDAKYQESGA